jgi:hypothetical protein
MVINSIIVLIQYCIHVYHDVDKCVIGTPQQKHLQIAYAPLVTKDIILQQPFYKLCIGIDLVNDKQCC